MCLTLTITYLCSQVLGLGFHAYGPGRYEAGRCTEKYKLRNSESNCFARYGNSFSVMGNGDMSTELDAWSRYAFNWLDRDEVTVIRADGQYSVGALADSNASKKAGLIVPDGATGLGEGMWLEYRRPIGFDVTLAPPYVAADSVTASNTQGLVMTGDLTCECDNQQLLLSFMLCSEPDSLFRWLLHAVIDARITGEASDWQSLSINTNWSDPYSNLTITIDNVSKSTVTFTVAGIGAASPPQPPQPPPPNPTPPHPRKNESIVSWIN